MQSSPALSDTRIRAVDTKKTARRHAIRALIFARSFIEDSAQLGRSPVTLLVPARAIAASRADLSGPCQPSSTFQICRVAGPSNVASPAGLAVLAAFRRTPRLNSQQHFGLASRSPAEWPVIKSQKAMAPAHHLLLTLLHRVGSLSIRAPAANLTSALCSPSRPRRLARPRTPPFHGDNTGSNPVGDANKNAFACKRFQ